MRGLTRPILKTAREFCCSAGFRDQRPSGTKVVSFGHQFQIAPPRRESPVTGRRALLLVPLSLLGVSAILSHVADRKSPHIPVHMIAATGAELPIVAVHGAPLGPHEEPLPAGARVRIGSTRYRHPK